MDWLWKRRWFLAALGGIYFLFLLIFLFLWGVRIDIGGGNYLPLAWMWAGLVVAYTLTSLRATGLDEVALKLFLGMPLYSVRQGRLTLVPLGFFRLVRVSIALKQAELPGEPDQIWRIRERDERMRDLPLGRDENGNTVGQPRGLPWVPPIRVTFEDNDPDEDKDPLRTARWRKDLPPNDPFYDPRAPEWKKDYREPTDTGEDPLVQRVTVETALAFQWRVQASNVEDFFSHFTTEEDPETRALQQLSDIVVSETTDILQIGTLARAQGNIHLLGRYLERSVQDRVKGWGVTIVRVQLKPFGLSHELNLSIQQIPEAKAARVAAQEDARAIKLRGKARAAVVTAQRKAAGDTNEVIVAEAARDAIASTQITTLVIGQGGAQPMLPLPTPGQTPPPS
jgi:hypothetical protein